MIKYLIIFVICLSIASKPAYAYIDPGTGSMIIQAIAGFILAGTFTFKIWSRKIKEFITKKNKITPDNEK